MSQAKQKSASHKNVGYVLVFPLEAPKGGKKEVWTEEVARVARYIETIFTVVEVQVKTRGKNQHIAVRLNEASAHVTEGVMARVIRGALIARGLIKVVV